jgi:hypothetical protein
MLFAIPFAAVGVGMAGCTGHNVLEFHRMQAWVEVPAEIIEAKLEIDHDSDSGKAYRATAKYKYQFNGVQHVGDRVALHGGSDNVGDFQNTAYAEIKRHLDRKQPFRCFVNPDDPAQAVLYRNLRWEMMLFNTAFGCIFGSVGFGLLAGAVFARREARKLAATAEDAPADEPWKARADWASGQIPQRGGTAAASPTPTTSGVLYERLHRLLAGLGALAPAADSIAHGTTIVTNAIVEGRQARTALVTTRGFRDVLEIARQSRQELYRLDLAPRPAPLVPRHLRLEVTERVLADGRVALPLAEDELPALAAALRASGVEAVAVCLLHAYAHPAHEARLRAALEGQVPFVSVSHEINAEYREYERTATTVQLSLPPP